MSWLQNNIQLGAFHLGVSTLELLLRLVLPFIAIVFVAQLLKKLAQRIITALQISQNIATKMRLWVYTLINSALLVIFLLLSDFLFTWDLSARLIAILTAPFYSAGESNISILTLILFLPVLYVAVVLSKYVQRVSEQSTLPLFIDNVSLALFCFQHSALWMSPALFAHWSFDDRH